MAARTTAAAAVAVALLVLGAAVAQGVPPDPSPRKALQTVAQGLMDPTVPWPWHAAGLSALVALPEWGALALALSDDCASDLQLLAHSFQNASLWALKMFDSSTKIPEGLIFGDFVHMGNFDECISVQRSKSSGPPSFDGQHCMIALSPQVSLVDEVGEALDAEDDWRTQRAIKETSYMHLGRMPPSRARLKGPGSGDLVNLLSLMPLQVAWCVPSSCSPSDVQKMAAAAVSLASLQSVNVSVTVTPSQCHTYVGKPLRHIDMIAILLLVFFVLCAIASTIYDLLTLKRDAAHRNSILLVFSVYSNVPKLLAVTKGGDQLSCLNGIRFISMCWVMLCHVYMTNALVPSLNFADFIPDFVQSSKRLLITNGTLSVDSFFLMSGLLLSFLFLKEVNRTNRFNVIKFYVHRYVRLTPALAILILLSVTLLDYAGTGPLWDTTNEASRESCEQNWWTNLLYVNNYVHPDKMCLGHTWYLAVDMQLYWLSPLVLLPLWKLRRRHALLWVGFLLLVGWAISFTIVYVKELSPSFIVGTAEKRFETMKYYYWPAYTRYVPWLIGVLLGYILHGTRKKKPELSRKAVLLGKLGSSALSLVALNAAYPFQQRTWEYNPVEAAFWLSLFRAMWALGLAWTIFACDQGYGGILNKILSWSAFQPLSRLCYGLYLTHIPILQLFVGVTRSPNYLADINLISQFFGVLLMSVAWTIPMILLFESPIILMEKSIFAGSPSRPREPVVMEYQNMDNPDIDEVDSSNA